VNDSGVNDSDLISAVRESVSEVYMTVPADDILRRGRAIRTRRRVLPAAALVTAAGVAVAAVLGVTSAAAPRRPSAGHALVHARLAAWDVLKTRDGTYITLRALRDPAALQSRLRADGIPASVTNYGDPNPACRRYPARAALLGRVNPLPWPVPGRWIPIDSSGSTLTDGKPGPDYLLRVNNQYFPPRAGVQISISVRHGDFRMREFELVRATPGCTG
jgi:hypothetical protein